MADAAMNYMTFKSAAEADRFAATLAATGFVAIRFVFCAGAPFASEAVKSPDAPAMLIRGLQRVQAGRKMTKPQAEAVAKFPAVAK